MSFNGFAAKLTDLERKQITNMKEVVCVFPNTAFRLQTTFLDFISLDGKIHRNATVETKE